jgi:hypothetical protein
MKTTCAIKILHNVQNKCGVNVDKMMKYWAIIKSNKCRH